MSQYSLTDPGLPFGTNTEYQGGGYSILSFKTPKGGLTGIEHDLIAMRDPVKKAYRDLIVNW